MIWPVDSALLCHRSFGSLIVLTNGIDMNLPSDRLVFLLNMLIILFLSLKEHNALNLFSEKRLQMQLWRQSLILTSLRRVSRTALRSEMKCVCSSLLYCCLGGTIVLLQFVERERRQTSRFICKIIICLMLSMKK